MQRVEIYYMGQCVDSIYNLAGMTPQEYAQWYNSEARRIGIDNRALAIY